MDKFKKEEIKKYIDRTTLAFGAWQGISNPFSSDFESLDTTIDKVNVLVNFATGIAGLVAVIVLVYGGYMFIISTGDGEKIDKAMKIVTNSIVGLVIIFIANLIIRFLLANL
jgi:hypothetical protein